MSQQSLMHEVLTSDTQWHLGAVFSSKHLGVHGLATKSTVLPYDSIYSKWLLCNWRGCRDYGWGMLCTRAAVTHISSALPRPRQRQQVCGPRLHTSFLSPSNQPARMSQRHLWPAPWHRQAKSSSCTQTQPFSHQCVSGGQRREALRARWLVRTRKQQAGTESNHCGRSTAERARTPAVWSTLHISLQQHFFFPPPPPLWLIITHERDQYSIIWPSAKLRQNQSVLKKVCWNLWHEPDSLLSLLFRWPNPNWERRCSHHGAGHKW